MNRWAYRILIALMLVIFTLVFVQMYRTLVKLQQQQEQQQTPATRTTT